jgi:Fic family protein
MTGPVPYHTGKFPPPSLDWTVLIPLLGPASAALARYDGLLSAIPNAAVLLSPLTTQEAVLSSMIEGTQATMGEVLEYEAAGRAADLDPQREEDIQEVLNYRRAMRQATELLNTLPLCNRLIQTVHETLLAGVRGHDRGRGKFRTIQNHIGRDHNIDNARFVPIAPEGLVAGMARWERYLHEDEPDRLVQLAIVHAEFESLHPFLDGNGRIGRMLVPLFLFSRKLLHAPMFYLSEYLETNRQEYSDRLLAISRDGDWTGWCLFFLKALTRQAANNETKARQILELYRQRKEWGVVKIRSQHTIRALDFLFNTPIFNSTDFIDRAKIPGPTARRILNVLSAGDGVLRTLRESSGRRPAVYAFSELINIAEGRPVV